MQKAVGGFAGLMFVVINVCMPVSAGSNAFEMTREKEGFESCGSSEDFVKCMNQMKLQKDPEVRLREKMRDLSFKISSILSLPESESDRDELRELLSGLLLFANSNSLASSSAKIAQELYLVAIESWLNAKPYSWGQVYGYLYKCGKVVRGGIDLFNSSVGSKVIEYKVIKKAPIWGMEYCDIDVVSYYEKEKLRFISGILREGSIHPSRLKEWSDRRDRIMDELIRSNWEKHLDENPGLRAWARANPKAAIKQSEKFNKKRPLGDVSQPPTYIQSSDYLSKVMQLVDFSDEN